MTVLTVLAVLEITLPSFRWSYKIHDKEATVTDLTVLAVLAVVAVSVVTATPLKLNPPFPSSRFGSLKTGFGAFQRWFTLVPILLKWRVFWDCPMTHATKERTDKGMRNELDVNHVISARSFPQSALFKSWFQHGGVNIHPRQEKIIRFAMHYTIWHKVITKLFRCKLFSIILELDSCFTFVMFWRWFLENVCAYCWFSYFLIAGCGRLPASVFRFCLSLSLASSLWLRECGHANYDLEKKVTNTNFS